jgi:leader peptidase (prepilin peptidase) / N-methyltransferase
METIILIVLLSLAWGSFLNVVIYRLPRNMNLNHPPSTCPGCGRRIRVVDNIPVLSFLILRGKCRTCETKIPFSYFLVEILTPLAILVIHFKYGLSPMFFASAIFTSAMIVLALVDFYHQILPDEITIPGLVMALIFTGFRTDLSLRQAMIAALVGAGFLLAVYVTYWLIRRKEGLGMGDVTLMLFIGAFVGLRLTVFTLIAASLAGAVIGVIILSVQKKDLQHALPFGSFLAPAAYAALVWGDSIVTAYLRLFQI